MESSDQFMNVEEAARLLSRTQPNIRTLLRNGGLKGAKIGARWYVSRRDLDRRIGVSAYRRARLTRGSRAHLSATLNLCSLGQLSIA